MNRIGFGFDSHRFVDGRPLKLCGVLVEHPQGLLGHSDGDAAIHAVIDAMLGGAGLSDIGEQFPDTDPRWKNADSIALLGETVGVLVQMGWSVVNCDITIVCQAPRLTAYKAAMRERIAEQLGLETQAVGVKGKTAEGMGFIGTGEGLAAYAVVLLESLGD